MTKIPITRVPASVEKQKAIRKAVRAVEKAPGGTRLATLADKDAFTAFLSDPAISAPIYTLPRPINRDTVSAFIARHLEERARGEGLLLIGVDEGGVTGYHDAQFWPKWSACELGGAIRADLQGAGAGAEGAASVFSWLFETIGVDLICETAALDNHRTARLLDRIGFTFMGRIESELAGGGARPSLYWELTRDEWRRRV